MPSDVEICNIALSRVAHSQPIASLTEKSKAAELCRMFYGPMRELVLRAFPWPFAESLVALADIGTPAPGWAYRYRYPSECLKVRNIVDRKSTRLNSSHGYISYAVFCLKQTTELQSRLHLVCRLLPETNKIPPPTDQHLTQLFYTPQPTFSTYT